MAWSSRANGPVVLLSETTTNSSSKTLLSSDLPKTQSNYQSEIEITGIRLEISCSATVGTRNIKIQLLDALKSDDVVAECGLSFQPTAGGAGVWEITPDKVQNPKNFSGVTTIDLDRSVDGVFYSGSPRLIFATDYKLKIWDAAAIDPTGDTLIVHIRALGI